MRFGLDLPDQRRSARRRRKGAIERQNARRLERTASSALSASASENSATVESAARRLRSPAACSERAITMTDGPRGRQWQVGGQTTAAGPGEIRLAIARGADGSLQSPWGRSQYCHSSTRPSVTKRRYFENTCVFRTRGAPELRMT